MHPTLLGLLGLTTLATARYALNIPPTLSTGPITADYLTPSLDQSDLDSPKLSHANASTFDWWHFDAIGIENPNASVAITFANAGPDGFPLDRPGNGNLTQPLPGPGGNGTGTGLNAHSLWAHIWVTFADGRRFRHVQAVDSARMHGSGDSSVAIWHGAGGWMGSEEGYEVEFDVGDGVNITGGISMERITSSHSRCSTASNFSSALDIGDSGLGWVAVMPDAIARVDVNVNGERLNFEGYGYHDKVWSSRPFTSSTKSLQRGRAHLGLYSVLWLSYTSENNPGQEIVSSFLARDGENVNAGCADGSVTIIAGQEQTEGGLVSGFQVGIPGAQVNVATDNEERGGRGAHLRWNGRARGMVEGVDEEGVAIFERFEY